jgi:hypothetical protein
LTAVYTIVRRGGFVGDWMYGWRNRSDGGGWVGRIERSARNCGVVWYGRYVNVRHSVLYSCTLEAC